MNIAQFYEKNFKDNENFNQFLHIFLEDILPKNTDINKYKQSAIEYLFYDNTDFLYQLKYQIFRQVDSKYLFKLFTTFQKENEKWVSFIWNAHENKEMVTNILTVLGNKKVEVLQTVIMPSFKSLENDVKNSEIVTSILNSILMHLQEIQQNQNMMLANISHEMRTPLNSVIGYLDVLDAKNNLSKEDRQNVTYAKNSSKLLLTLINDLLDTQKLASAKLDLTYNPFWINKIVKNAILISSVNATQKNIDFIYVDKLEVFNEVIGDKNRFLQILNNLFSNAIKFTPSNKKVKVTAISEDLQDSIKVRVIVEDEGIGIAKDKQKELFKPFSRATNKEKGTGLGLYISKQLAQKMGGDIWFESEENVGSTFVVELNFKKSEKFYDESLLKGKKIVIFNDRKQNYCQHLITQFRNLNVKLKVMNDTRQFVSFLMLNHDIDMVITIYPSKIEKDDMDKSFIQTYKLVNEKTLFVAIIEENYYPNNIDIFDKHINIPLTLLDIMEIFSSPKNIKKSYKYLIIDDEPTNRMVLSTMIKTFDKLAKIDTANNGLEGLDKIFSNQYDVIFLDKRMPKMDGYEVLEELKKLNKKENIYLLTADGDNETITKAKEYNVGYISKPVSLTTIKSIVSTISDN